MARWLTWTAVVIVWTVALEFPVPKNDDLPFNPGDYKFLIGKTLHVCVYAGLTVLSTWVPTAIRYRWLMMFFLLVHAWGTEMLQERLHDWCGRGGSLGDVGFDIIGIVIGLAFSWKAWTRET